MDAIRLEWKKKRAKGGSHEEYVWEMGDSDTSGIFYSKCAVRSARIMHVTSPANLHYRNSNSYSHFHMLKFRTPSNLIDMLFGCFSA